MSFDSLHTNAMNQNVYCLHFVAGRRMPQVLSSVLGGAGAVATSPLVANLGSVAAVACSAFEYGAAVATGAIGVGLGVAIVIWSLKKL